MQQWWPRGLHSAGLGWRSRALRTFPQSVFQIVVHGIGKGLLAQVFAFSWDLMRLQPVRCRLFSPEVPYCLQIFFLLAQVEEIQSEYDPPVL